jgi:DNA-binding HxlR family transcriptional regulator
VGKRLKTTPLSLLLGENLYYELKIEDIARWVTVKENRGDQVRLGTRQSKNDITTIVPFVLDERVARLVGMMPDGSVSKDLASIEFSQKKDLTKISDFKGLLDELFCITRVRVSVDKTATQTLQVGSRPLAIFTHYCLDVPKSDEPYRVPAWIIKSPLSVVKVYVAEVFAMEGSVCDPTIGKREVRLHSCDFSFMRGMQNLLEKKLCIKSSIFTYHIKDYGDKYYLRIGKRENLSKLRDVGITLATHQRRLESVCNSYKPAAWKISLVAGSKLPPAFTSENLASLLGTSKRATLWRIKELKTRGLVVRNLSKPFIYSLTEIGQELASQLSSTVKIQPVRTNPCENEKKVKEALEIGLKTKHDIARFAGITHTTVREVLIRIGVKLK